MSRNPYAHIVRTPAYRPRIVKDARKEASRTACRKG